MKCCSNIRRWLEAVTFAVPHPTLGEDVASAIVLRQPRRGDAERHSPVRHRARCRLQGPAPGAHRRRNPQRRDRQGPAHRPGGEAGAREPASTCRRHSSHHGRRSRRSLAECWAEILQVEQVGIHDDFFALGGDSLSVTHVLARVYEVTHLEIEVSRFFDAPTIAEMAHHLETSMPADQATRASSAIARAPREGDLPASIAQERLCKMQLALPGMPFFNVLHALRLTSAFDAAILERSLNEIVRRHEILRTTFAVADGRYVQVVAPQSTVHLRFDDLRALPESRRDIVGHRDHSRGSAPLFRPRAWPAVSSSSGAPGRAGSPPAHRHPRGHRRRLVARRARSTSSSLCTMPSPAGEPSPLAPLSIQYADFAYWQRHWQVTSRHRRAA